MKWWEIHTIEWIWSSLQEAWCENLKVGSWPSAIHISVCDTAASQFIFSLCVSLYPLRNGVDDWALLWLKVTATQNSQLKFPEVWHLTSHSKKSQGRQVQGWFIWQLSGARVLAASLLFSWFPPSWLQRGYHCCALTPSIPVSGTGRRVAFSSHFLSFIRMGSLAEHCPAFSLRSSWQSWVTVLEVSREFGRLNFWLPAFSPSGAELRQRKGSATGGSYLTTCFPCRKNQI